MAVRLFIGNLSYDVTEAELRVHFATLGSLTSLALPMDRDTGKPRGFAFVEFRERADAEEAIRHFNTQLFKGRPLAVSEALARDGRPTPSTPRAAAPQPRPPAVSSAGEDRGAGDDRGFGPDAAPRHRRPRAKRASKAEPRQKPPLYKRTTGPVRFSVNDDDDEGRDAHLAP